MKTVLNTLTLAFAFLSAGLALADGPCGNGKYVYQCTPGRCGEPSGCHMVCVGPSDEEPASDDSNLTAELPEEITVVNACL